MFIKRVLFTLLAILLYCSTYGQTGIINAVGGGSVPLMVTSLTKYKDGMSLENWTKIRIRYDDPTATSSGWILQVQADFGYLGIMSDNGADSLDLETLDIRVVDVDGTVYTGTSFPVSVPLSNTYAELLRDNQKSSVDLVVTISYDLGIKPAYRLLGKNPGFYFVDLRFNLISKEP